jgi:hypothetical protein
MKALLFVILMVLSQWAIADTDFSHSKSRNLSDKNKSKSLVLGQSLGRVFRGELIIVQQENDSLIKNTIGLNIGAHLFSVGKMAVHVKAGRSSITNPFLSKVDTNLGVELEYRTGLNQSYVVSMMNRLDPIRGFSPDVTVTAGVRFYF